MPDPGVRCCERLLSLGQIKKGPKARGLTERFGDVHNAGRPLSEAKDVRFHLLPGAGHIVSIFAGDKVFHQTINPDVVDQFSDPGRSYIAIVVKQYPSKAVV